VSFDPERKARRGFPTLSTAKRLKLETGRWECKQNTRCCGLLLTYTTDSAIFSSAALNGL
jgi:hypothetical protein